jgi:hypothetical protein
MVQTKIYGVREQLNPIKARLSDIIYSCVIDALHYPADKRAHRFFPMDASDFFYPAGRTDRYTIVEFSMIAGRSVETKKQLIRLMFERIQSLGISPQDLEITIFETPAHNWGFRGLPGDEHLLNYKIEV